MVYFYAPSIEVQPPAPEPDGTPQPPMKPMIDPAELDTDGETWIQAILGPNITFPKYDRTLSRFVVVCKHDQAPRPGWEIKTVEEINIDYPGLIGD